MIAIADAGSTKCDWVFLQENLEEAGRCQSLGFNPNQISEIEIRGLLAGEANLLPWAEKITQVFFYGSGCGTTENQKVVQRSLQTIFPGVEITVREDLLAAAYAAFRREPCLVGILGTGSNVCFFDGQNLRLDIPSLGFILGDEGSGSALGKAIVKDFFMKKMPAELAGDFAEEYQLDIDMAIDRMFHQPRANAWFAGFSPFLVKHRDQPYVRRMVQEEFQRFFHFQVSAYPEWREVPLNLVGSIGLIHHEALAEAARNFGITLGTIIAKPIEHLVDYHRQFLLKPN